MKIVEVHKPASEITAIIKRMLKRHINYAEALFLLKLDGMNEAFLPEAVDIKTIVSIEGVTYFLNLIDNINNLYKVTMHRDYSKQLKLIY